jgi:hypothetical protein
MNLARGSGGSSRIGALQLLTLRCHRTPAGGQETHQQNLRSNSTTFVGSQS